MKTITINNIEYEFDENLSGGYFNPINGWHHYMGAPKGKYVFNIDENGKMFFNCINQQK